MDCKFNINHIVKVKLTDHGENVLAAHLETYKEYLPSNYNTIYSVDAAGYREFQLWDLMYIFSDFIYPGAPICFENNEIIFNKKDLE